METSQETPATSLPSLPPPEGQPNGLVEAWSTFTGPQRAYLVARASAPSLAEAARHVGVQENTVYGWRSYVGGFRRAEAELLEAKGDTTLQLARALYRGAMPSVAQRQITQALRDDQGLGAQALMAQQRAREAVTKGSGMEDQGVTQDPVRSLLAELYTLATIHAARLIEPAPARVLGEEEGLNTKEETQKRE